MGPETATSGVDNHCDGGKELPGWQYDPSVVNRCTDGQSRRLGGSRDILHESLSMLSNGSGRRKAQLAETEDLESPIDRDAAAMRWCEYKGMELDSNCDMGGVEKMAALSGGNGIQVSSNILPTTELSPDMEDNKVFSSHMSAQTESCSNIEGSIKDTRVRRVSFPEDDSELISGYLEPVNPWCQLPPPSLETADEIASEYMRSCERHGSRPLPLVIQQIRALPLGVGERIECLSLRGQRLDASQCEGLEEVFRRVQFKAVDLEGCGLDDDAAVSLFDMVEFYDSATCLNIACNSKIGFRGWQACSRLLKRTPSIQVLDAHSTNLNEQNLPILGRALRSAGSKLRTLHLENCNLTGRPLLVLTAALKQNVTLTELYLADNRLGAHDCIQLGNLVRVNRMLKLLDLRNNNLQDSGCGHICEAISEQLLCNSVQLTDESGGIVKGLSASSGGLISLVLWNNYLTYHSIVHLALMLSCVTTLETLNLGHNNITSEGVLHLKESLMRNRSLLRLGLQAARVGDEGAVALAEYIADNSTIQRIDLRENPIRVAGLMALAHSLRLNNSLLQLDVDSGEPAKGVEMEAELAERLIWHRREIREYCARNLKQSHLRQMQEEGGVPEVTTMGESALSVETVENNFRKISLTCRPPANEFSHGGNMSGDVIGKQPRYVSPEPSPAPSPCPSPMPSPAPHSSRSRFKVFKVIEEVASPIGSPTHEDKSASLPNSPHLKQTDFEVDHSNVGARSFSTGDLCFSPGAFRRMNRLGGRFTVTPVSDKPLTEPVPHPLPPLLLKSIANEIETEKLTEGNVDSPRIIVSSPIKVMRGFDSVFHNSAHDRDIFGSETNVEDLVARNQHNLSRHDANVTKDLRPDPHCKYDIVTHHTRCSVTDSDCGSMSSGDLTDSGFADDASPSICPVDSCDEKYSLAVMASNEDLDSLLNSSIDSVGQDITLGGDAISPVGWRESMKRAPLASMDTESFDSESEEANMSPSDAHVHEGPLPMAWGMHQNEETNIPSEEFLNCFVSTGTNW